MKVSLSKKGLKKTAFYLLLILLLLVSCNSHSDKKGHYNISSGITFSPTSNNKTLIKIAKRSLDIQYVDIDSVNDIFHINIQIVKPVVYNRLLSLESLSFENRKKKFIDLILPQILISNYSIKQEQAIVKELSQDYIATGQLEKHSRKFIHKQYSKYMVTNLYDLQRKLNPLPVSIILAQAAIESDWGSSKLFYLANNPFGVVSNNPLQPRLKINKNGKQVYYKKYKSFIPAVFDDYFKFIITDERFEDFQQKLYETKDPFILIKYLTIETHSETYQHILKEIIQNNHLTQYDSYKIDPEFIKEYQEEEIINIADNK